MNDLEKRVIDLSHKLRLSHIGSCLNAVNVLDHIYSIKKENEPVILSSGHMGLALYVVLEAKEGKNAEELYQKHGTHPCRDVEDGIWCSTGSLGQGLTVAVGMAMADKTRNVYVVTSDGEMAEGSCWEALRVASELKLENLRVSVIANGYGAYGKIDTELLDLRMQYFYPSLMIKANLFKYPGFLQGLEGHYKILTKGEYEEITKTQ